MAMRFLRVIFVCSVILCICPAKSGAQIANIGHPGVRNITLSLHVKDPEDVVVARNEPAVLRCPVRSFANATSAPTVQWLHRDVPVPDDDSRRIFQRDGSLHVQRVTPGGRRPLTGPYRCLVKNEVGVLVTKEAALHLASLELEVTEEKIEVIEQQAVILPCQARSIPEANVRWDFNKQTLPHGLSYVPLPSGALLILKSLRSYAGIYRCIVTNSVLKKSKIKTVTLTVLAPFLNVKPVSFLPIAVNSTVTLGMRISLYCLATGWPLPKVEWLRDDIVVGNTTTLEVSANRTSAGAYVCRAYNDASKASQVYHLTVHQRPYFVTTPKSYSYTSPSTVKLECRAGGLPEPCIRWLKNGKPIRLGERIGQDGGTLVISHTFTNDAGMYQCEAFNSVGSVWSAAQVVLTSPNPPPPPPEQVQCRPYDEHNVCVTWKTPPNIRADAFSIYVFFNNNRGCREDKCQSTSNFKGCENRHQEEFGPEYVATSGNHYLADRLNASTNYSFYVRLYSKAASDGSNKVSCFTAVQGERNLKFRWVDENTIELNWSEISSDIPCGSYSTTYMVQWKKENYPLVNTSYTESLKYNISGLLPSVMYHFRVMSSTHRIDDTKWAILELPGDAPPSGRAFITPEGDVPQEAPTDPDGFRATRVGAKSVTLGWIAPTHEHARSYVICYVELAEDEEEFDAEDDGPEESKKECEEGNTVASLNNVKQIDDLKPNTLYEFKIQALNAEGLKLSFSSPLRIRTHPDVPSTVLDLKYEIINESTACLAWLPPLYTNGNLINYTITYTPNPNRPIEEWTCITIPASRRTNLTCFFGPEDRMMSVLLLNLKQSEEYTVMVRAGSNIGLGSPNIPFLLKTMNKKRETDTMTDSQEDIADNQKMGVVVGCILALICIACCVSCIALRRRCVKRRERAHARLAAADDYRPSIARYASQGASAHVRLEGACAIAHETQNLVTADDAVVEVPALSSVHLDTKGRDNFPNGYINGLKKPSMNGHLLNGGHVHITENPQYDRKEKNGDLHNHSNHKTPPHYALFHDDPNSNRIHSPANKHSYFLDTPSPGKLLRCSPRYDNGAGLFRGHLDDDGAFSFRDVEEMERAHARYVDDPFVVGNHRRISPLLGPNG